MDSIQYCPHRVLQELILNWSFTKIELARFIHSHSVRITAALKDFPDNIHDHLSPKQTDKLIRIFRHMKNHEDALNDFLKNHKPQIDSDEDSEPSV